MTFRRAFLVAYVTMISFMGFVVLATYAFGGGPQHPHFALALLIVGVPVQAVVAAWAATKRDRP